MSQLFLNTCELIASHFYRLGYKYSKGKRELSKTDKAIKYSIKFHTSHSNSIDVFEQLLVSAIIESREYRDWQSAKSHSLRKDGIIFAGHIGNILKPFRMIEYNLYNPNDNVNKVIDDIQKNVITLFDMFEKDEDYKENVKVGTIEPLFPGHVVEYFVYKYGVIEARELLVKYKNQKWFNVAEYNDFQEQYRKGKLPDYQVLDGNESLAYASFLYDL